jgi:hypothetical protein
MSLESYCIIEGGNVFCRIEFKNRVFCRNNLTGSTSVTYPSYRYTNDDSQYKSVPLRLFRPKTTLHKQVFSEFEFCVYHLPAFIQIISEILGNILNSGLMRKMIKLFLYFT